MNKSMMERYRTDTVSAPLRSRYWKLRLRVKLLPVLSAMSAWFCRISLELSRIWLPRSHNETVSFCGWKRQGKAFVRKRATRCVE